MRHSVSYLLSTLIIAQTFSLSIYSHSSEQKTPPATSNNSSVNEASEEDRSPQNPSKTL